MKQHWFLLATISVALLGGASGCHDEPGEAAIGCPADWQRPFAVDAEEYPFVSRCALLTPGILHYIDEQPAVNPPKGTVLAIHGNPTWSFLYRKMIKQLLAEGYRVIAPDNYGFGMSDKPPLRDFDYRASAHAAALEEFVRVLDLTDITLVVQDWGGPVGFGMAVAMPERIRDVLIMNSWAWEVDFPDAGETVPMHVIHDWGMENIVNEAYYVNSAETAFRVGRGLGFLNGEPESLEFTRVRDAMWGPFLTLEEPNEPIGEHAIRPINIFAQALLTDWQFLRNLDAAMSILHDKPVYFMFGDDTAFGPLKCDTGPFFPHDFDLPAVTWNDDDRPLCPAAYQCSDDPAVPLRSNCVDDAGNATWPILDRWLAEWNPSQVVGVWQDPNHGHWLQDEVPEVAVEGVIALTNARDGQ